MLLHTVTFESTLTEAQVIAVARGRKPAYEAVPGLVQKYYVKHGEPNTYSGVMLWESAEALAAFRETELARTVGDAFGVKGAPRVQIGENMFSLREGGIAAA